MAIFGRKNRSKDINEYLERNEDCKAVRLMYIKLEPFKNYNDEKCIGRTVGITSQFKLPEGVSLEDACKIISYITEKVEKENKLEEASEASVSYVSRNLEKYGFVRMSDNEVMAGHYHETLEYKQSKGVKDGRFKKVGGVADLITVDGDEKAFDNSQMAERYFNWFEAGVTKEEVVSILTSTKIELDDAKGI